MSNRQQHLETAFSDIPSKIGAVTIRRLSPASFTLLSRLGNPMIVGKESPANALQASKPTQAEMFDAVVEYVWVHSAELDEVVKIETADQLPIHEIRKIGHQISIGEAFEFLLRYEECATRMAANLSETEAEDEDGNPGKSLTLLAGSPASSTSAEPAEIRSGSDTSSGSCPSSEASPIFTLPTLRTGQDAVGQSPTSEEPTSETHPTTQQS